MDKQKILDRFSQTRRILLQAIQLCPEQALTEEPVEGVWTIKDLLAHIRTWEEACLVPLRSFAAGAEFIPEDIPDHLAWNERQYNLWSQLSPEEIWASFHDVRRELEELLQQLPEERWNEVVPLPWGENRSIRALAMGLAWHEEEHTKSILRVFGFKTKADQAAADFQAGYVCSQSVLAAFAPDLGLERELALRAAAAFGGGIGRMGLTCGAVTGALMVIGLKSAQVKSGDSANHAQIDALASEFVRRFEAEHGSITCRTLLGQDISTAEGLQAARENGLFTERCPQYVTSAVTILEGMLADA